MPELMLSPGGYRYGAFPSARNPSDPGFPAHLVRQAAPFPARGAILTKLKALRQNQLTLGCCTAEGSTNLGNTLWRAEYLRTGRDPDTVPVFDPLFTYYAERLTEGTLSQGDCGAQVVTSLSVPDGNPGGGGYGWCPQTTPFDPANLNVAPTQAQLVAAKTWVGGAYHNIGNVIANIKSCILSNYSGVIGIAVYDSFESDATTASGFIPYPNLNAESLLGYHEMHSLIAYDDTIQCPGSPNPGAVLTENSWGPDWGWTSTLPIITGRGVCWISYDYLMNPMLTTDVRMAHLGRAWG